MVKKSVKTLIKASVFIIVILLIVGFMALVVKNIKTSKIDQNDTIQESPDYTEQSKITWKGAILLFLFFIIGILMFMQSSRLELIAEEGIAEPSVVMERLERIHPHKKKTMVLDTSFIRAYTARGIDKLTSSLQSYDLIIVPDRVIKELKSQERKDPSLTPLRRFVEKFPRPEEGFEPYRKPAKSYLEKSRKNIYYETIIPILLGEKQPPKTRREVKPLADEARKLLRHLKEDGLSLTRENLIKTVERHYKVSDTDVDVLAASLAEVKYTNKPVVLAGKDVDFYDSVRQIHDKPKRKVNWKLLEYRTPYVESAA